MSFYQNSRGCGKGVVKVCLLLEGVFVEVLVLWMGITIYTLYQDCLTIVLDMVVLMVNLMRRKLPLSSFESLLESQDRICTH